MEPNPVLSSRRDVKVLRRVLFGSVSVCAVTGSEVKALEWDVAHERPSLATEEIGRPR